MSKRVGHEVQVEILKALSNPVRLSIISLLNEEGPLSFSNILDRLGLKKEEAGKFHFHLRKLMAAYLVEKDQKTGVYYVTELGRTIISWLNSLTAEKEQGSLILHDTINDTNKRINERDIYDILTRKMDLPKRIASEVAQSTIKKLREISSETNICSITNVYLAIQYTLYEMGYAEYAKHIFSLAVPSIMFQNALEYDEIDIEDLGALLLKEYIYSKLIPRNIYKQILRGVIHIPFIRRWPIRAISIRYPPLWIEEKINAKRHKLDDIISRIYDILFRNKRFVAYDQVLDHINFILAQAEDEVNVNLHIKNLIRMFGIMTENGIIPTLILDLYPNREIKSMGLIDYEERAKNIAKVFLNTFLNDPGNWILENAIMMRIGGKEKTPEDIYNLFLKSLSIWGVPGLINGRVFEERKIIGSYSSLGLPITFKEETYEYPLIISDVISLNTLKMAIESNENNDAFLDKLYDGIEMVVQMFEIKHKYILKRLKDAKEGRLLVHNGENLMYVVNLSGLIGACSILSNNETDETISLLLRDLNFINNYFHELSKGHDLNLRVTVMNIVDEDTHFSRTLKEYSDLNISMIEYDLSDMKISLNKLFTIASRLHMLTGGGHVLNILVGSHVPSKISLERLLSVFLSSKIHVLCITPDITLCKACGNMSYGYKYRCDFCSALGSYIIHYGRRTLRYEAIDLWPTFRRMHYLRRYRHILV
ncbi:MAG: helix-turn-helix domain-containing protein [Thermoprotei archaeon]|nr:helix-turn-helix domain-containing protein [Thermoprotei archaeon]